jgi:hypothetical protein
MAQVNERSGVQPRIVVVGTCASGKSTLVAALCQYGYDAHSCAQEHSAIPDLWKHLSPDLLVYLDVDLKTVRRRRSPMWPEPIFKAQCERLSRARVFADIVIDTEKNGPDECFGLVEELVNERFPRGLREVRVETQN